VLNTDADDGDVNNFKAGFPFFSVCFFSVTTVNVSVNHTYTSNDGQDAGQEVEYSGRRPVPHDGDDVGEKKKSETTKWK